MTKQQIDQLKKQVDFANSLTDEEEKTKAFKLIDEQRNEMLLDCFSKQSDRIKLVVSENAKLKETLNNITIAVNHIEKKLDRNVETFQSQIRVLTILAEKFKTKEIEKKAFFKALNILKSIGLIAGGGGATAGILKLLEYLM